MQKLISSVLKSVESDSDEEFITIDKLRNDKHFKSNAYIYAEVIIRVLTHQCRG